MYKVLKKLLKHGQYYCVYPSAYVETTRQPYTPEVHRVRYEDVELTTSDGVVLRCFLLKPREDPTRRIRATVIMFLGNAMEIGGYAELLIGKMYYRMRCNVLMVSYRGYGLSKGTPSEKGLRRDAQAALDHVISQPQLAKYPVVAYGLSLGGAVAIDLTNRNPTKISALIVENTFTSLPDVVHGWPLIGLFSVFCHQKWKSSARIGSIPPKLPILFLSGRLDQVVPPKHMELLFELALLRGHDPKAPAKPSNTSFVALAAFEPFPWGSHADTWDQLGYSSIVTGFLDRDDIQKSKKKDSESPSTAPEQSSAP
ncbi:hypothetical protein AMATHDRAFT_70997 [Amanita thiersii Skay4041]|uniref:Serine aminopeptidase S33 domain-containing protein n=1 Tax=Amanita thiersii Skay4041 TaxID=703135 RepID=A0A2A9N6T4_9AGAR|nr:hypothetical protein AMATHDRAFT_70997 [Amanita thiersii Skay4041]